MLQVDFNDNEQKLSVDAGKSDCFGFLFLVKGFFVYLNLFLVLPFVYFLTASVSCAGQSNGNNALKGKFSSNEYYLH